MEQKEIITMGASKKATTLVPAWTTTPELHQSRVGLYSSGAAGTHVQPRERPRRARDRRAIAESRQGGDSHP